VPSLRAAAAAAVAAAAGRQKDMLVSQNRYSDRQTDRLRETGRRTGTIRCKSVLQTGFDCAFIKASQLTIRTS